MNEGGYRSPSVGREVEADFLQVKPNLISNIKSLISIVEQLLGLAKPKFTILNKIDKETANGGYILNILLSESHLVLVAKPRKDGLFDVHYQLYSCLGHNHGIETYAGMKDYLQVQPKNVTKMPIVIDDLILSNEKKIKKYQKYLENHDEYLKRGNAQEDVSFVGFGIKDNKLWDNDFVEKTYLDSLEIGRKNGLQTSFHRFKNDITGKEQGATGLSIGTNPYSYSAFHSYPEHNSAYFRFCNLEGTDTDSDVKKKLEFVEDIMKPKKILIYRKPIKSPIPQQAV